MYKDKVMRQTLWVSVFLNMSGALLLAFPASAAGQLIGLPTQVPLLYRLLLALFVALFGGAYVWLACQPTISRPLVAFAALAKSSVFLVTLMCWLSGQASGRGVLLLSGHLLVAGLFAWWLSGGQPQTTTKDLTHAT